MTHRNTAKSLLIIIIAAMLLAAAGDSYAKKRTSKDVKTEKQKTEKEIAKTKKQIAANDRETGIQLDRLKLIKANIALRNDTIMALRATLDSVNTAISGLNDSIKNLEVREQALKTNYAKTLRTLRSRRQGMNDLSFIFSSTSFSQAWQRMRYLRQIAKTSVNQAHQLATAKEDIEKAKKNLERLRAHHASTLGYHNTVQTTLMTEQTSADNLIKNLKRQGKSLQRELDKRNKQALALARELDKIVEQEIREAEERRRKEAEAKAKAEAEARARAEAEAKAEAKAKADAEAKEKTMAATAPATNKKTASPGDKAVGPIPATDQKKSAKNTEQPKTQPKPQTSFESEAEADRRLTGSFVSNKGKLLFPVSGKYTVVSNFGTNEIPELSKVKVDNLGIDIEVPAGVNARSIFDGVVSSIFRLDGYNNIVIVRHGEYLSVYAGIGSLNVKKGDNIKTGQTLGTVYIPYGGDDRARLHFEIRHEKQKLNPTEWVR